MIFSGSHDTKKDTDEQLPLYFYNSQSKEKELFMPVKDDFVRIYACGPTVYDVGHVGNIRAYVLPDIIRRALRYNGFRVKAVMNFTDVGHLSDDGDNGDDKMVIAIKREGKEMSLQGMREVADIFIERTLKDMSMLNILTPHELPRASDHIEEQIVLIQSLMEKEYAYRTTDGVYFDTKRFPDYGKLGNIPLDDLKEGARVEENPEKRNPTDFALWKRQDDMGWDSPWGKGFPGWHIECSAMAMKYLGKMIDIHTGGIDLMPTHHNNEIAQCEAATNKQFVKYWMHNAFVNIDGTKFAKSLGNSVRVQQIEDKGYNPLAYRYWLLTSHYRTPVNFTWEALDGAMQALRRLHRHFFEEFAHHKKGSINTEYERRFNEAINDDLDTPKAIAIVWDLVKDDSITPGTKRATLLHFDKFLAVGLKRDVVHSAEGGHHIEILPETVALKDLPEDVRLLVIAREEMREEKKWDKADELRNEIKEKGYLVEDTSDGPKITTG